MDPQLEDFIRECEDGLRHQVQGNSEPFLAVWSQAADVAILGAIGSYAHGWHDVRAHLLGAARSLDWTEVAVERVLTQAADGLALSVALERMTRHAPEPTARTLRVTHGYRHEDGRWRLMLRHANLVTDDDEAKERALLGV
jgi:ketosteroid isomerase-like protein